MSVSLQDLLDGCFKQPEFCAGRIYDLLEELQQHPTEELTLIHTDPCLDSADPDALLQIKCPMETFIWRDQEYSTFMVGYIIYGSDNESNIGNIINAVTTGRPVKHIYADGTPVNLPEPRPRPVRRNPRPRKKVTPVPQNV